MDEGTKGVPFLGVEAETLVTLLLWTWRVSGDLPRRTL